MSPVEKVFAHAVPHSRSIKYLMNAVFPVVVPCFTSFDILQALGQGGMIVVVVVAAGGSSSISRQ